MSTEDNNTQAKGSIESTSINVPSPSESTKNNEPPASIKTLNKDSCTLQFPEEEQKTSNGDDLETNKKQCWRRSRCTIEPYQRCTVSK